MAHDHAIRHSVRGQRRGRRRRLSRLFGPWLRRDFRGKGLNLGFNSRGSLFRLHWRRGGVAWRWCAGVPGQRALASERRCIRRGQRTFAALRPFVGAWGAVFGLDGPIRILRKPAGCSLLHSWWQTSTRATFWRWARLRGSHHNREQHYRKCKSQHHGAHVNEHFMCLSFPCFGFHIFQSYKPVSA